MALAYSTIFWKKKKTLPSISVKHSAVCTLLIKFILDQLYGSGYELGMLPKRPLDT